MKLTTSVISGFIWAVAIGLAAWVLLQLPLTAMTQAIAELTRSQWLVWIALNLVIIYFLVSRWFVLTKAMKLPCTLAQLLRVRQAGGLISFVTPGPQFGGEPFQVYWLWTRYKVSGHEALLALGLDRFYELWINFAVLLIAVMVLIASATLPSFDWFMVAVVLTGLCSLMAVVGWFVLKQPQRCLQWIKKLSSRWLGHERLRSLETHWSRLTESLQRLITHQRGALSFALILSLLGWLGMIGELWLLLSYVNVQVDLAGFVLLFTVIRLAFLLPLPGGIGSVEAGLFWSFQALSLPLSAALGLIALMRLRDGVILLTGAAVLPGLLIPQRNSSP